MGPHGAILDMELRMEPQTLQESTLEWKGSAAVAVASKLVVYQRSMRNCRKTVLMKNVRKHPNWSCVNGSIPTVRVTTLLPNVRKSSPAKDSGNEQYSMALSPDTWCYPSTRHT